MDVVRTRRLAADEWELFRDARLRALLDAPDAFGATYAASAAMDESAWRGWLTGEGWDADLTSFVVEEGGVPIGIATCAVFHAEPEEAYLFSMWVVPSARGRGAGRSLVEAVADLARAGGCQSVVLRVNEGNDEAAGLYASCGFVGTDAPPEPLREGSDITTVEMRLLLHEVDDDELMAEQMRYYEDRAPVYEEVYFRTGEYAIDGDAAAGWHAETAQLESSLADLDASGDVLELACGSGLWTRFLAPHARTLLAVDASEAMLARNRELVADDLVEYVRADLFTWDTDRQFDLIVMGFWISHVPPARFDAFWGRIARWLCPGGTVWFTDDAAGPLRPAHGARIVGGPAHLHQRRLGERSYSIAKLFWRPEDLQERLRGLGWDAHVHGTGQHFLWGTATR